MTESIKGWRFNTSPGEWQKAVNGRITVMAKNSFDEDGYTGSTVTLDATHALEIEKDENVEAGMVKLSVVGKPHLIRWVRFTNEWHLEEMISL
tara:strand:+ start:533 stop:811 length:279 start_codon:yes stop_codon:yes gene_type:complete